MQVTIQDKKENIFLDRTEVKGTISFEGTTPSNVQLAEALAQQLKKEVPLVVIKQIHTSFGQQGANFLAFAYHTLEAKQKTEKMTKHLRSKLEEEKKKAAE